MTKSTTTSRRARPAECDGSCSPSQGRTTSCSESCIILRLSKWLWSCRAGPLIGTGAKSLTPADASQEASDDTREDTNAFPCRACQTQGVRCDRQKPRCAHCLDQQILCFYVEPLRVTMKRRKQAQTLSPNATPPALQEGAIKS